MVSLKLMVNLENFDLTHVDLLITVLGKRASDKQVDPNARNEARLRLTLPETHMLLTALRKFDGPIDVMTPEVAEALDASQYLAKRQSGERPAAPAPPDVQAQPTGQAPVDPVEKSGGQNPYGPAENLPARNTAG